MSSLKFSAYNVREAICINDITFIKKLILGNKKGLEECKSLDKYNFHAQCETVLMLAARNNSNLEMLKLLLTASNNINATDRHGATALIYCLFTLFNKKDLLAKMALLIQNGADINAQNNIEDTALIIAVKDNLQDVVGLLLDAHADTSIKNSEGETALSLAIKYEDTKIIELLTAKNKT